MKINKVFSMIAVGLLAMVAKAAEVPAVYEVRAWQGNSISGTAVAEPVSSLDNPLVGGAEVRFVIRLLSTDYKEVTGYKSEKPWKLHYVGSYSDDVAWAVNRPKIALSMGDGIIREAEVEDYEINSTYKIYTDIICKYVVQPGDLALPVRFALTNSGTKINLVNGFNGTAGWQITNGEVDPDLAALTFDPNVDYRHAPQPESLTPNKSNTDLSISGFYVRTVDFRDRNNEENSWYDKSANIWRAVHAGSSSPAPSSPAIQVTGTPKLSSKLYVWSDDDTIVDLPEGVPMDMPAKDGKSTITRKVHTIAIEADKVDYRFPISAPDDKEGESTVLYLSENPGFVTTSAGLTEQSYLTIPVAVIKKLEPNITVTATDANVIVPAGNDQTVAATELTVEIASGYTGDGFDVAVTPLLYDTEEGIDPWYSYVRISEQNGGAAWTTQTAWTKHFANTGDPNTDIVNGAKITLYVYALGADNHTAAGEHQILFTPSVEGDGGYFKTMNPSTMHLKYEKPVLTVPPTTSAVGNVDHAFDLTVSDNYKNLNDSDGYTIEYKKKASDSKWTAFKGSDDKDIVWRPDATGVLKKVGDDRKLTDERPSLKYNSGTYETSFRVKLGSDASIVSEPAITTVTVSESARATVLVSLDKGKTYVDSLVEVDEGANVMVKVKLSVAYEGETDECYAFLKPVDETTKASATGKAIIGSTTGTQGMKISRDDFESQASTITLTDGVADGTELRFEVVLCTEMEYKDEADKQVPGYQSKDLRITSMNVIPKINKITMGNRNTFVTKSGESMHDSKGKLVSAPMGVDREFSFEIDEPSTVDRTAEDTGDKKDAFRVEYEIVEFDGTTKEATEITGNPSAAKFTYKFTSAGEATVTVRLLDKDMRDPDGTKRWGEEFVFYVDVSDHPYVALTDENGEEFSNKLFYENMTGAKNQSAHMFVKLSETASKDLDIKLTVTCEDSVVDPYKCFKLGGGGLVWSEKDKCYTLTIKANQPRTEIWLQEADGTKITSEKGFSIKAEVTTDTDVPTAPGTKWKDYFTSTTSYATVENCKPEIVFSAMPCAENDVTNAFVVAVGTKCEFKYTLSDVPQDTTTDNPLTVSWTVGGNSQDATETDTKDTYTFTPDFANPGIQSVQVSVTDKDNYNGTGFVSHQWFFDVQASKKLTTLAHGPASGFSTSALSQKYNTAAGIGKGHVWANGIFAGASGFKLDWNMGVSASAYISAAGYKCDDKDNGSLGLYDEAIDTNGSKEVGGTIATYYTYEPEDKKDSYLYVWLKTTTGEGNGASSVIYGGFAPEVAGEPMTQSPVALPDQKNGDNLGYEDTIMEAIFSKEYRWQDNCGDINQDGIPDRMVVKYNLASAGDGEGANDLRDMSADNDDADFLPAMSSGGYAIVPNTSNNWEKLERAFNAFLEVRGFGVGLNARYPNADEDKTIPDRDFTDWEEMAFRTYFNAQGHPGLEQPVPVSKKNDQGEEEFKELAGLDPDQEAKLTAFWASTDCKWTPENPTNPTEADTDKDGLPDGYEYWFWYGATVGYPNNGVWQKPMTGKRFVEADIDKPEEIKSVDIANAFNPTVTGSSEGNAATRGTLAGRDFDNDGISDIEEFLIGTNPVQCDSDGDGMIDGWEIMNGLNPLDPREINPSQDPNNDGDFMAYSNLRVNTNDTAMPREPTLFIERKNELGLYDIYITNDKDFYDAWVAYWWKPAVSDTKTVGDDVAKNPQKCGWYLPFVYEEPDPLPAAPTKFYGAKIATVTTPIEDINKLRETLGASLFKLGDEYLPAPGLTLAGATYKITEEDCANMRVLVNAADNFAVIHDQVYNYFGGFDPRTGWGGPCENTVPYNTIYEYRLFKYRQNYGGYDGRPTTMLGQMLANTTNPSKPYSVQYGEVETTHANDKHGADTDSDGLPDGWELYLSKIAGLDPITNQDVANSPDGDGDKLNTVLEFAGTTSTLVYEDCPSIMANFDSVWPNKFYPTNPASSDTDNDGITDWQEGNGWEGIFYDGRVNYRTEQRFTFNYDGSIDKRKGFARFETCYRGGGLNPNSFDTDQDGLPDLWEWQFAGFVVNGEGNPVSGPAVYTDKLKAADGTLEGITPIIDTPDPDRNSRNGNGHFIAGGMDGTYSFDAYTDMDMAELMDYRTGTYRDFDFDGDGLQNYQEYLVQAVRSFRYDDSETPLNGRIVKWPVIDPFSLEESDPITVSERVSVYTYPSFDYTSATNFYALAIKENPAMAALYAEGALDPNDWDWAATGYFAPPPRTWDPNASMLYMQPPSPVYDVNPFFGAARLPATRYVSTDPRQWDSDMDGMDDYWELYHGLNPLYGGESGRDIISEFLGEIEIVDEEGVPKTIAFSAKENVWTRFGEIEANYDFDRYPWLAGAPDADPDNDKIRNFEEAITGNMTSPTTSHTDPTPLWMTEPSAPLSVTRLSYAYYSEKLPWAIVSESQDTGRDYMFTFEGNEGYDTDNDWTADSRELTAGIIAATDPLVASDPYRRAAIYIGGEDNKGVAYQRTGTYINPHSEKLNTDAAYDMFRQFTVECWVKPEAEGTILERGAVYTPATAGDEQNAEQWRANFRLEFKNGKFVGSFDDSAAVATATPGAGAIVTSRDDAKLNEWTHLALSYDGKELRLYVNGEQAAYAQSSLIPANGIVPILQDPASSADYPDADFTVVPGSFVIGARHIKYPMTFRPELEETYPVTIEEALTDFFKGYVAEVRIWDGARTGTEINSEKSKAYTFADVEENRTKVFEAWSKDARRNDNASEMGTSAIPPQLMMHYDFTSLPGATKADDVALVPGAFNVKGTFAADNDVDVNLLTPSWWVDQATLRCKSTVYTDATVLPWIENTVAHLSAMDGSFADSIYWANARAAYVPSNTSGFDSFMIPNSANPYGWATYENDNDNRRFKVLRYEEMHPEYEGLYLKRRFDNRSRMVGVTDLLPLGGAFAKRESDYWDGQGAMTAWTLTQVDSDGDGVPDWYTGLASDYMRDLVAGLLPNMTKYDAYRDIADFNGNGLPDWWEQIYGILGKNGHEDSDNDGLSNYVEYLLNEVYTIPGKSFDPINAKTNGYVPDAYVKLGKLYIGDVFTDHDHMADTWEVQWKNLSAVSPYIYDANKDQDGDGWSNYAEFQSSTDPTKNASLAIDGIEVAQYPVPIVEASITYLGEQNVNCPIVVQAWNCADEKSRTFQSIPDAKWTIGEVNSGDDRQTTSNTNVMAKTKFVGMNPAKEIMTHLSPGSVVAGSFKIEFKDPNWLVVDLMSGQSYSHGAESADWESLVHDSMRNDNSGKGDLVYELNGEVLGEIDYATGEVVVDFSKLPEYAIFTGDLADPTSTTIGATIVSVYTFAQSYTRIAWSSKPVSAGRTSTYYLGDADPRSESNNSVGHLKEGKNNFIVFADTIDANGKYDPGEPFGIAYNVDVGWNYGKFAIELTDTNPVFARYQLTTGMTDRQVVRSDTGDVIESEASGAAVDPTTHWTRIYMQAIKMNGQTEARQVNINGYKVMDKVIDYSDAGRNYIHEGDILDPDNGIYDIGWGMIDEGSSTSDTAEAIFGVVLGNVAIEEGANARNKVTMSSLLDVSNALVQAQCIVRRYDSFADRKVPTPIAPGGTSDGVVYSPRPTFKWTDNGYNTYTAFQISVEGDDFSWKSGVQLMPARGADGYYCWTAPICVGDLTTDGKEFKNDETYKWKITSYNAKFRSDKWSNAVSFKMNVPDDQLDYGTIDVAVKYFGHTDVLDNGTVRVEAFDTPDFSGLSASAGYVKTTDKSSVSDDTTAPEKNASIIGLTEGNYYVMAYIDTNNNGKHDNWEGWGYACVRDQRDGVLYTPKSIKVGPKVGSRSLVTVYIDDCDTDQDGLPDAWEWKTYGNLSAKGAEQLNQCSAGSYVSIKELVNVLDYTTKNNPVASGLATLMSVSFGNPNTVAMLMDLNVGANEDPNEVIIKTATDAKIAEHTLSIANFQVQGGKAKFSVVADVESEAKDKMASVFYTFPVVENLTVNYQILKYTSLAEKPTVAKTGTIELGKTEAEIEMPLESEDATGAMYQIKVFQK